MANNICYKCGSVLPAGSERCPNCGAPAPLSDDEISRPVDVRSAIIVQPGSTATRIITPQAQPQQPPTGGSRPAVAPEFARPSAAPIPAPVPKAAPARRPPVHGRPEQKKDGKRNSGSWIVVVVLAVILAAGIFGYTILSGDDADAERSYAIVDVPIRSSKMEIGEGNVVGTVPYGASLITYENDGEWVRVKYEPVNGSRSMKGFVPERYLLNRADFFRLQSIFGTADASEAVPEAHHRRALVNYFTAHGLIGRITDEGIAAGLPEPSGDNQWQLKVRNTAVSGSEVFFGRVFDPASDYEDMAVILRPLGGGPNRLVYFTFDNDATPVFRFEREVGSHNIINSVRASRTAPDGIEVTFVY